MSNEENNQENGNARRFVSLHIGEFSIESLGVESPSYFQGYGLGPSSRFHYCAYGVGDTEEEALDDCLEMVAQSGFEIDEATEKRIRDNYGATDTETTARESLGIDEEEEGDDCGESPLFHIGMKWNAREEERLERLAKLHALDVYRYEDYRPIGPSERFPGLQNWGYIRRLEEGESAYWGDIHGAELPKDAREFLELLPDSSKPGSEEEEGQLYAMPPHCSGSDYSGDTVTLSNKEEFLKQFEESPWVFSAYGAHGTYGALFALADFLQDASDSPETMLDVLEGLENYPVIDEEAHSQKEMELQDEEWDSWVQSDFTRALEKQFPGVEFVWPEGQRLREFFEEQREAANVYWHAEGSGPSMHVDVSRVAEKVSLEELEPYALRFVVRFMAIGEEVEEYWTEEEARERVESLRESGTLGAHYVAIEPKQEEEDTGNEEKREPETV